MKTSTFLYSGLAAAALWVSGCQPPGERGAAPVQRPEGSAPSPKAVAAAPLVLTPLGGGESVPVSRWSDRPVYLVFFAPWTDSADAVRQWIRGFPADGGELVPVVVDRRPDGSRVDAASLADLGRTVYLAEASLLDAAGGVRVLPTVVRVDGGERLAARWEGVPALTGIVAAVRAP